MILTRIKRGAVRTHVLIRNKIENLRKSKLPAVIRATRSTAASGLAASMVVLPTPLHSQATLVTGEDGGQPPSIVQPVAAASAKSVELTSGGLVVIIPGLAPVKPGESLETAEEDEQRATAELQARLAREEEAQKQAQLAQQRQQELAREQALYQEHLRAQQAATPAVALASVSASAPVTQDIRTLVIEATDTAFGAGQGECAWNIISRESGGNPRAMNASSGAYGIGQALPGVKMAPFGADWRTNPTTQLRWFVAYIAGRYGTPCRAWGYWITHRNY